MVFFLLVVNLQQQTLQLKKLRRRDEHGAPFLAVVELNQPACGKYFEVLLLGAGRCRQP